jgi:hypothetical protein
MRSKEEIENALAECFDKVWYSRHCGLVLAGKFEGNEIPADIKRGAFEAAKRIEDKYSIEELNSMSDFEWGMLCGKLSALRWMLGDDWDNLDT